MRITESKLRSFIRSIIRESDEYYATDNQGYPVTKKEWDRQWDPTQHDDDEAEKNDPASDEYYATDNQGYPVTKAEWDRQRD